MRNYKSDLILTYTIKPNIFGGLVARVLRIPVISNITGLENVLNTSNLLGKIVIELYKHSIGKARHIFFQNRDNKIYLETKLNLDSNSLIPGSGVNLDDFPYSEYPKENNVIKILYFGRLMKSKGLIELLETTKMFENSKVKFQFIGFFDDDQIISIFNEYLQNQNIEYIEHQANIIPHIVKVHAVILPSHHEGMSNSLLESAAIGRPLLASNISGCKNEVLVEKSCIAFC